ncbi:MAG: slipin family protein, partial [Bdellovibrionales bacterium]|nr:slipin family protein [Bdellovibrionales bacterium]
MPIQAIVFLVVIAFLIFQYGVFIFKEYERGVLFTLGRYAGMKDPGLRWIWPGIQKVIKIDQRTITMDIPTQDVITKDNVSVKVNAVLYYRVVSPEKAVIQVEEYNYATSQLAQT